VLAAPEVLSTGQLAARLGKSIHTLIWWRREGRGPKYTRITPSFIVWSGPRWLTLVCASQATSVA
jgi:hypothetical protein